jgi:hypothetical protein
VGHRTTPQVVAVAEPAGQHDAVDAADVGVGVPELDGVATAALDRDPRVTVVEGSGEGHDTDAHARQLRVGGAGGRTVPDRPCATSPRLIARVGDLRRRRPARSSLGLDDQAGGTRLDRCTATGSGAVDRPARAAAAATSGATRSSSEPNASAR